MKNPVIPHKAKVHQKPKPARKISKSSFGWTIKVLVTGILIGQFGQPLPFKWDQDSKTYEVAQDVGNAHFEAWQQTSLNATPEQAEAFFVDPQQFAKPKKKGS